MVQARGDGDWVVRIQAVGAIGSLVAAASDLAAQALTHVVQAIRDGDGDVRMHAVKSM